MKQAIENDEITAWLCRNAKPIGYIIGTDTHDLKPLVNMLSSVRVVGLAEATHGTREFFQIRHRMLRFLVIEMGFNALAIEASYSAAQAVNEYILNGEGDLSSVLTGLGFVMWDVEEFSDALAWLHDYNETVCSARKVRFYGVDIWNTRLGRERVLAFLRIVAPERVSSTHSLFQGIASAEARGMMLAHKDVDRTSFLELKNIAAFLATNSEAFARETSADECQQAIQHLGVILQWMSASLTDELTDDLSSLLPKTATLNNYARSRYMAENLLQLMERDRPDTKVVIWAHAFHLAVGFEDPSLGTVPNMGQCLKERLGERY
jgi:erythromycin esterase